MQTRYQLASDINGRHPKAQGSPRERCLQLDTTFRDNIGRTADKQDRNSRASSTAALYVSRNGCVGTATTARHPWSEVTVLGGGSIAPARRVHYRLHCRRQRPRCQGCLYNSSLTPTWTRTRPRSARSRCLGRYLAAATLVETRSLIQVDAGIPARRADHH